MQMHGRRLGTPSGLPAVLAHCFLGNGASWKPLLDALAVPLNAQAPDLPGHGRSPMPEAPGDFHAAVAGALGVLVSGPSLLMGHSFGAASMLRYALHHRSMVRGLVLIEPVFFAAAAGEPEYAPYRAGEAPLHEAVAEGRLEDAARHFLSQNPGSPDFDRLAPAAQAQMAAQMRLVAATGPGLIEDSGGLLAEGVMAGFDAPVLLIAGSETAPIFHATIRGLARMLPKVEAHRIEGAGHMVPISHPAQTARLIGDWMARHGLHAARAEPATE